MLHVYTGDGKGKTTAALGLAMRAAGRGMKVCIVQFMKGRKYGELESCKKIGIDVYQFGRKDFVHEITDEDRELAMKGMLKSKQLISSGKYDLVILDELAVAVHYGLISINEAIDLVSGAGAEIVITGRNAPRELVEIADYVTEMRELKHPFKRGIGAREGIEY